jgi:hypothetical protein
MSSSSPTLPLMVMSPGTTGSLFGSLITQICQKPWC